MGEAIGLQLRDLLLRFPCAVVEGVRWSSLCKAYRERFPDAPNPGAAHPRSSAGISMRAWLADVAECSEDNANSAELWFRLRDVVALTPGTQGQLACWPLLVQRLGEIVRTHGILQQDVLQPPSEAAEATADAPASGAAAASSIAMPVAARTLEVERPKPGEKVVGVLLAQLKPLLRRHWDPAFEEKAVGYYNEFGNYVSVKKMKHLVAELLKWRMKRRSQIRGTAVDAALQTSLMLVTSSKHNDMVLCSPLQFHSPSQPVALVANRVVDQIGSAPAKVFFAHCAEGETRNDRQAPKSPTNAAKLRTASESMRLETAERDCQRLKIENAELKKRVRFGADFLYKEIRRLRIENAELKKRLYPSTHASSSSNNGSAPSLQNCMPGNMMQAMWVPVALTPGSGGILTPPVGLLQGGSLNPSGHPSGQASPVPQGFCYAMPFATGTGQPWGAQMMAMPVGSVGSNGSFGVMSPSGSDHMRLLPQDLLSNTDSQSQSQFASHVSERGGSPEVWSQKAHGISVPPMQLGDRWAAIPSGIVDGRKAELEATELQLGGRVREGFVREGESGEGADGELARQTSSDDEEPLFRSRSC